MTDLSSSKDNITRAAEPDTSIYSSLIESNLRIISLPNPIPIK
jgi:hypothetical protein